MGLNKISITKAEQIVYLYLDVLEKGTTLGFQPCSSLPFEDLHNSANLILSYDFKNGTSTDWAFSTPLINYSNYFLPDKEYEDLQNYDIQSKDYKIKGIGYSVDYFQSLMANGTFSKFETTESFLKFCESLGRENQKYWQLVYERLGLQIDNSDNKLDLVTDDTSAAISKKKNTNYFNTISNIIFIISFVFFIIFILDKTGENLLKDLLKVILLAGSYFFTKFLIRHECLKNDKKLSIGIKIFYDVAIIFVSAIVALLLSNRGEDLGTDYNLFFEYLLIIALPAFFGAYRSFYEDSEMSAMERLEEKKKLKGTLSDGYY